MSSSGAAAPDNTFIGIDGRPAAMKNFLAYSLRRLGVDYIDIYRLGRVDPEVPIEETVGAIAEMIEAGYVRYVVFPRRDRDAAPGTRGAPGGRPADRILAAVARHRSQILPTCRDLGVSITAYGVLSRGLLGGELSQARSFAAGDFRAGMPRFRPENLERNLSIVEGLREIAVAKGATVAQVAIAWVLSRGEDIVPLVGMRRRGRVADVSRLLSCD